MEAGDNHHANNKKERRVWGRIILEQHSLSDNSLKHTRLLTSSLT